MIVEVGVNDINASIPQATFASNYAAYLAAIKSGLPGVKIGCVSVFCDGEQYPDPADGPGGPTDFNTIIAGVAYNAGAYYLDVRTAQQAYEAAHNTPAPGVVSGVLTAETPPTTGIHPNATGVTLMGNAVLSQLKLGWLP